MSGPGVGAGGRVLYCLGAERAARGSRCAGAVKLLRLPGHVPMPAFREVVDVPMVVRRARRPREQVGKRVGLQPTHVGAKGGLICGVL